MQQETLTSSTVPDDMRMLTLDQEDILHINRAVATHGFRSHHHNISALLKALDVSSPKTASKIRVKMMRASYDSLTPSAFIGPGLKLLYPTTSFNW